MARALGPYCPDIQERRAAWQAEMIGLDVRRLVFIDETWASTNMARRYGYSRRGQRLIAKVPYGHWKTTTFYGGAAPRRSDRKGATQAKVR